MFQSAANKRLQQPRVKQIKWVSVLSGRHPQFYNCCSVKGRFFLVKKKFVRVQLKAECTSLDVDDLMVFCVG